MRLNFSSATVAHPSLWYCLRLAFSVAECYRNKHYLISSMSPQYIVKISEMALIKHAGLQTCYDHQYFLRAVIYLLVIFRQLHISLK